MTKKVANRSSWPPTTEPVGQDVLILDADCEGFDDPTLNLSAAARLGDTLFLGSDEGSFVERLQSGDGSWTSHERVSLASLLGLDETQEADIEGLATQDGWLWVLGSHARTRPKLAKDGMEQIDLATFARLKDTRPRCLLARLPLVADPAAPDRVLPVASDGERRAGMLKQTKRGNCLAQKIAQSAILGPFAEIAAKEGGVDLEGIAVAGSRVAIGMRGPVLQTYAVLLEMQVDAKSSGALRISGPLYKRLLMLDGLGIRDLKLSGSDLLVLAGPTTGLDGPCAIYRWRDWLGDPPRDETVVRLHRPERIVELPFGRGDDHPEGLVLLDAEGGAKDILVICDSPASARIDKKRRRVRCDRFRLP